MRSDGPLTERAQLNRYLLVMTACIDPSGGRYPLQRASPAVRLEDYKAALRFWLNYPDDRIQNILFIENSNYPLDSLKAIVEKHNSRNCQVEFVSLDCNWYPQGGHYGYAELKMLDLGLQQSRLLPSTTHMIKVSGRLTFPALSRLLNRLPAGFDAAADTRAYQTLFRRHPHPNVTTQIILFRHRFYQENLQRAYEDIERGVDTHMEGIYYRKLAALKESSQILFRFPCNVPPVGFPAHRERSYTAPSQRAVDAVRAVARHVLPDWWI
jgi:hypothetical protein